METRIPRALILGLLLYTPGAVAAEGPASIGPPVVQCQAKIVRSADKFVTKRRKTLERCLREGMSCAGALSEATTQADDPCLADIGARCRAKLAAQERLRQRLDDAGPACFGIGRGKALVTPEGFFGEDGLGFVNISPLCPDVIVREGEPSDASVCQRSALRCGTDRAVGIEAPRAAEFLERLGIGLEDDSACLAAQTCGNAELDGDEDCDDGPANSDTAPDACRMTCVDADCGDGVLDSDEDCDDGNLENGDGCDEDCFLEDGICGNGTVESDEDCDDGNLDPGDGCDEDCLFEDGICGNGVVETDEDCDDGNVNPGDGCDEDCFLEEGVCGNGVIEGDEECDDGPLNSDLLPDACRTDCTEPVCGDGIVDLGAGEECEPPASVICTPDCELRLSPLRADPVTEAPAMAPAEAEDLAACQQAIIQGGNRVARRTQRLVQRCVMQLSHCVVGIDEERDPMGDRFDACLHAAGERCVSTVSARDSLVARTSAAIAGQCRTGEPPAPISLGRLVDPVGGLGFDRIAAACPFSETRAPTLEDLLACVLDHERCIGESAVAATIPRANEFLWELDIDDPDASFPCVVDPTDYDF